MPQQQVLLKLPSERMLHDYTHYFKHKPGFQPELKNQHLKESQVNELSEQRKYCGILFDEMKVKESIVYDKFTGSVVGFTNLGEINDLCALEQECREDRQHAPVAKHLLLF